MLVTFTGGHGREVEKVLVKTDVTKDVVFLGRVGSTT